MNPFPPLASSPIPPSIVSPPKLELKPLPDSLNKGVVGWSVADLKGISPTICMHRIHLEDDAKPIRQMQHTLNTHMNEVVHKVVKLLDADIIYPISDSQ